MSHAFRHRATMLLGFALLALLLFATPARAQNINCSSVSMTPLTFGSVNPLSSLTTATATLSYTCTNSNKNKYSATLCFSIGEPGGAQTNPRLMLSGTNTLPFQLYQDPGLSSVWGSQFFGSFLTPLKVNITLVGKGTTSAQTATMYGQIPNGQTSAIPTGTSYKDNYQNGDTALTINEAAGGTAPGTCDTGGAVAYFPFLVSATVVPQCQINAPPADLNLGTVPATAVNQSGTTSISVSCTSTTPYNIGLSPSSANGGTSNGTGNMVSKTAPATNTDKVPYTLYSNVGLSTVWGNTATASSRGNGVSGSGTGLAQSIPVWAKAPSADYTPDSYQDTVTVNVNY